MGPASLLSLPDPLLRIIARQSTTATLFQLMDTSRRLRALANLVVKERLVHWGVEIDLGWSHSDTKQAYLWLFGQPVVVHAPVLAYQAASGLTSRGLCLLAASSNLGGGRLVESSFAAFKAGRVEKSARSLAIPGLVEPVGHSDLTLFRYRGQDIALVRRPQLRLVAFSFGWQTTLGEAEAVTVDSTDNAQRIARVVSKDGAHRLEWCDLEGIGTPAHAWKHLEVPCKELNQWSNGKLFLDWLPNAIVLIGVENFLGGRLDLYRIGTLNLTTGDWEQAKWKGEGQYRPRDESPLQRQAWSLCGPRHPSHEACMVSSFKPGDPLSFGSCNVGRIRVAALNPCGSPTMIKLIRDPTPDRGGVIVRNHFTPLTPDQHGRAFSARVIGRTPFVFLGWDQFDFLSLNDMMKIRPSDISDPCPAEAKRIGSVWRLVPTTGARAALELGRAPTLSDSKLLVDGWGEHVLEFAVRVKAPMAVLLELAEMIRNPSSQEEDLRQRGVLKGMIVNALSTNQPQVLKLVFRELATRSTLFAPSESLQANIKRWYLKACSDRQFACASVLLQAGDLAAGELGFDPNNFLGADQSSLWTPAQAICEAIDGQRWDALHPILEAATNLSDQRKLLFYRFVVGRLAKVPKAQIELLDEAAEALRILAKAEPQLTQYPELLAATKSLGPT